MSKKNLIANSKSITIPSGNAVCYTNQLLEKNQQKTLKLKP